MYSIYILNNDKNGFIKVVNFLLVYVCIYREYQYIYVGKLGML